MTAPRVHILGTWRGGYSVELRYAHSDGERFVIYSVPLWVSPVMPLSKDECDHARHLIADLLMKHDDAKAMLAAADGGNQKPDSGSRAR